MSIQIKKVNQNFVIDKIQKAGHGTGDTLQVFLQEGTVDKNGNYDLGQLEMYLEYGYFYK